MSVRVLQCFGRVLAYKTQGSSLLVLIPVKIPLVCFFSKRLTFETILTVLRRMHVRRRSVWAGRRDGAVVFLRVMVICNGEKGKSPTKWLRVCNKKKNSRRSFFLARSASLAH